MTERYIVTATSGEKVIRTNSIQEAERYLEQLGGEIIDTRETT